VKIAASIFIQVMMLARVIHSVWLAEPLFMAEKSIFFSSAVDKVQSNTPSHPQALPFRSNKKMMCLLSKKQANKQYKQEENKPSLLDLSVDTIYQICGHLTNSPKALAALAETCSTLLDLTMVEINGSAPFFFPFLEIIRQAGIDLYFKEANKKGVIYSRHEHGDGSLYEYLNAFCIIINMALIATGVTLYAFDKNKDWALILAVFSAFSVWLLHA